MNLIRTKRGQLLHSKSVKSSSDHDTNGSWDTAQVILSGRVSWTLSILEVFTRTNLKSKHPNRLVIYQLLSGITYSHNYVTLCVLRVKEKKVIFYGYMPVT